MSVGAGQEWLLVRHKTTSEDLISIDKQISSHHVSLVVVCGYKEPAQPTTNILLNIKTYLRSPVYASSNNFVAQTQIMVVTGNFCCRDAQIIKMLVCEGEAIKNASEEAMEGIEATLTRQYQPP